MKSGITSSFVNWVHGIEMKAEKCAIIEYKEFQEVELVIYFKKKKEPWHPSDALFFVFITLITVKNILQRLVMIY